MEMDLKRKTRIQEPQSSIELREMQSLIQQKLMIGYPGINIQNGLPEPNMRIFLNNRDVFQAPAAQKWR